MILSTQKAITKPETLGISRVEGINLSLRLPMGTSLHREPGRSGTKHWNSIWIIKEAAFALWISQSMSWVLQMAGVEGGGCFPVGCREAKGKVVQGMGRVGKKNRNNIMHL